MFDEEYTDDEDDKDNDDDDDDDDEGHKKQPICMLIIYNVTCYHSSFCCCNKSTSPLSSRSEVKLSSSRSLRVCFPRLSVLCPSVLWRTDSWRRQSSSRNF